MQIVIKEPGRKKHRISLPSWLVTNRLSACCLAGWIRGHGGNISGKQLHILFRVVKAYKAQHPQWKLVEVCSHNGDYVEIVL